MKENERVRTKKKKKKNQSPSILHSYSSLPPPSYFCPCKLQDWAGMKGRNIKGWRTGRKKAAKFARKSWLNVRWCVKLIAGEALAHAAMSHILQGIGSSTQRGCRKKRENKSFFFFFPLQYISPILSYRVLSLAQFYVKTSFIRTTSGSYALPLFGCLFCVTLCPDNRWMRPGRLCPF